MAAEQFFKSPPQGNKNPPNQQQQPQQQQIFEVQRKTSIDLDEITQSNVFSVSNNKPSNSQQNPNPNQIPSQLSNSQTTTTTNHQQQTDISGAMSPVTVKSSTITTNNNSTTVLNTITPSTVNSSSLPNNLSVELRKIQQSAGLISSSTNNYSFISNTNPKTQTTNNVTTATNKNIPSFSSNITNIPVSSPFKKLSNDAPKLAGMIRNQFGFHHNGPAPNVTVNPNGNFNTNSNAVLKPGLSQPFRSYGLQSSAAVTNTNASTTTSSILAAQLQTISQIASIQTQKAGQTTQTIPNNLSNSNGIQMAQPRQHIHRQIVHHQQQTIAHPTNQQTASSSSQRGGDDSIYKESVLSDTMSNSYRSTASEQEQIAQQGNSDETDSKSDAEKIGDDINELSENTNDQHIRVLTPLEIMRTLPSLHDHEMASNEYTISSTSGNSKDASMKHGKTFVTNVIEINTNTVTTSIENTTNDGQTSMDGSDKTNDTLDYDSLVDIDENANQPNDSSLNENTFSRKLNDITSTVTSSTQSMKITEHQQQQQQTNVANQRFNVKFGSSSSSNSLNRDSSRKDSIDFHSDCNPNLTHPSATTCSTSISSTACATLTMVRGDKHVKINNSLIFFIFFLKYLFC